MSISAVVKDGQVVDASAGAQTDSTEKAKSSNGLGKDAFLQLLVAQMKYQDPLEPTSNTEYISQLATFSQLEELQNMQSTIKGTMASDLVGKTVIMRTTSTSTGQTYYTTGLVDYAVMENGKQYLAIKGGLFSIDDLDSVVDADYLEAYNKSQEVSEKIVDLPNIRKLTIEDKDKVDAARKAYDELSDRAKAYVSEDVLKYLKAAETQMSTLYVKRAENFIKAIPDTDKITLEDEAVIKKASEAYEALSASEKKDMSKEVVQKLKDAEEALKKLKPDVEPEPEPEPETK